MAYFFPADGNPFAHPADYVDFGSKFVCGPTCCTVVPSAPAHGVGVYGGEFAPNYGWAGAGNVRRGPACNPIGWAEVGFLVSTPLNVDCARGRRPRWSGDAPPSPLRRRATARRPWRAANAANQLRRGNATQSPRPNRWRPRGEFVRENDDHGDKWHSGGDDDCDCFDSDERRGRRGCHDPSLLSVACRVRRYRLYARPAYGWCGSYDVHQWQYAATDETVPKCDAIFIVLNDNPRARGRGRGLSWQPLESGDLVFVPGEPDAFRVHLYSDDFVY